MQTLPWVESWTEGVVELLHVLGGEAVVAPPVHDRREAQGVHSGRRGLVGHLVGEGLHGGLVLPLARRSFKPFTGRHPQRLKKLE